jgi:hypothetical protein
MLLRAFSCFRFWVVSLEDGREPPLRLELQTSIQNALYSPRFSPVNSPSHSVAILFKFHPSSVYPKTASRPFPTSTPQEQLTTFSSRTTKKATSPQAHQSKLWFSLPLQNQYSAQYVPAPESRVMRGLSGPKLKTPPLSVENPPQPHPVLAIS